EGGVLDVEVVGQAGLQLGQQLGGAARGEDRRVDGDVGGEHGRPAGELPDVHVVHVDHPVVAGEVVADVGDRHAPRRGFGEYGEHLPQQDRKSTRLNSSHVKISYAVFCLKKK